MSVDKLKYGCTVHTSQTEGIPLLRERKIGYKDILIDGCYEDTNLLLFYKPLWSSGQFLATDPEVLGFRFPTLPDFLRSSGSGTGSTQPREDN
jgi:hypothetical protein